MRQGDPYSAVGESLQADVMRFMAIIAFCLIAILALVRNVEPDPAPNAEPTVAAEPEAPAAAPPAPVTHEPGFAEAPAATPPRPTPTPVTRPPVSQPAPVAEPPPAPPRPARVAEQSPAPQPADPVAPPQPAAPSPDSDAGLTLRFASERDFLRLVNRGAIRVFAFTDGEVLAIGPDFRFAPASAPGALHELLPETIPALMASALHAAPGVDPHGAGYRWGITMPERMARQIRTYVERGASGELVIDRFGEVRLHEA